MRTKDISNYLHNYFEQGIKLKETRYFTEKRSLLEKELTIESTADISVIRALLPTKTIWIWLLSEQEDPQGLFIKHRDNDRQNWVSCRLHEFITQYTNVHFDQQSGVARWLDQQKIAYRATTIPSLIEIPVSNHTLYVSRGFTGSGLVQVSFQINGKPYSYSPKKLLDHIYQRNQKDHQPHKTKAAQALQI